MKYRHVSNLHVGMMKYAALKCVNNDLLTCELHFKWFKWSRWRWLRLLHYTLGEFTLKHCVMLQLSDEGQSLFLQFWGFSFLSYQLRDNMLLYRLENILFPLILCEDALPPGLTGNIQRAGSSWKAGDVIRKLQMSEKKKRKKFSSESGNYSHQ